MLESNDNRSVARPVNGCDNPDEDNGSAEDTVPAVKAIAAAFYSRARGSHDWDHTLRVLRLCERIGTAELADMKVVRVAALLHDIGRTDQDNTNGSLCHARQGARLARPIVESLPLTERQKENILHCIATHRFRGGSTPDTIEARVLFDADKLDAIGAVGVARAFLFAGEVGARLHNPEARIEETLPYTADDTGYREYRIKLCQIKDRMLTATGKHLAEKRHHFMKEFFNRFLLEYDGKG
jgi:uncharacterized protein